MLFRFLGDRAFRRSRDYSIPEVSSSGSQRPPRYLVTATIIRDEARFLKEFVLFHREVGVDHMLIYDDSSEDNPVAVLRPFIDSGFVTLFDWPRFVVDRNNQFLAYQHAVASQRGKAFWLAMIDADEFLFAPGSGDLKAELAKREKFVALGVYSHTFGTSGLDDLDDKQLVTRQLTAAASGDYVKNCTHRTIVQPHAVTSIRSANTCVLTGTSILAWDEDGQPIKKTGETGHGRASLRINHYFSRARNDFQRKISRSYFGKSNWQAKMQGKLQELKNLDNHTAPDLSLTPWIDRISKYD